MNALRFVACTLALLAIFSLHPAAAQGETAAERRERALKHREWLQKLLTDYLAEHPESDLNGDGKLTAPERSIHVSAVYRSELLEKLGETVRFEGDIEYAKPGGHSLPLDLYLPPKIDPERKPPLVIWFHGGGWRGGSKDRCDIAWLATRGFAVASIEYRSTLVAPFPNNIHDCKGAIRWLRAHAGKYAYDVSKIGVAGGSAGGHLASLMGTSGGVEDLEGDVGGNPAQSSEVHAVVDMCGVIQIDEWVKSHPGLSNILGLKHAEDNGAHELAKRCNADTHLDAGDPPVLILHGDRDQSVPLQQSRDFLAALEKTGIESELIVLPKTNHVGPAFTDAERQKIITRFFRRHLGGEQFDQPGLPPLTEPIEILQCKTPRIVAGMRPKLVLQDELCEFRILRSRPVFDRD